VDILDKIGIYKIVNKNSSECLYVGQTQELNRRKSYHFSSLKGGYHRNVNLQKEVDEIGIENIEFIIIEEFDSISDDELQLLEDKYIKELMPKCNINGAKKKTIAKNREESFLNRSFGLTGENNGKAKLPEKEVKIIKQMVDEGYRYQEIAELYGISCTHVSNIVNGRRWTYLE